MASDLTITLIMDNASKLKATPRDSKTFFAKGLPWKLHAKTECSLRTNNTDFLSFYVYCNWESESTDWRCDCEVQFILINKDQSKNNIFMMPFRAKSKNTHKGYFVFPAWSVVIDEREGFLFDGVIKVEARITIVNFVGARRTRMDFSSPIEHISTVVLAVDNRRLHVSKDV
ncbi:hypothetical protein PENTCL1PPCAC_24728, partial [Pristionchus entomophagus]